MKVVEVFSSIQGEGINIGRRATFVRLARCNLSCSYCDTRYAFRGGKELDDEELYELVKQYNDNLLIFTGGEPMLQIGEIESWMLKCAPGTWCTLALETNGTIDPGMAPDWFDHAAVSPKLASSGAPKWDIGILESWRDAMESVEFKFVIDYFQELFDVQEIVHKLQLFSRGIPVILQPNGQKEPYDEALQDLVMMVKDPMIDLKHARILPQLHRVIWGKEARGV